MIKINIKCPLCDQPREINCPLCNEHWDEFAWLATHDFQRFQEFNDKVKDALLASDQ